jgi:N-acetylneuraminic acid mutarotase
VYDPSSGRLIMFGGSEAADPFGLKYPPVNTTWAYDPAANSWTELKPSGTVPPPLSGPSMAYDPATKRLIMFGGCDGVASEMYGGWLYPATSGTWAYDPATNTWTELKPSGKVPPPRSVAPMAYDPATGRMIMFGGMGDTPPFLLNDTWAYDPAANTWTELKPSGTVPSPRQEPAMTYDPSTGRLIMFGGYDGETSTVLDETWAYDPSGNTWTNLNPSGTLPEARFGSAMTYDSSSRRAIMFGGSIADGSKYFDNTWAYDPVANTWTELKPLGTLPGARYSPSLVYAPSTGQVVMFGGVSEGVKTSLNDTWTYTR